MVSDVQKYCESCQTCKWSKLLNQKPHGLLNPLSIPLKPWESIRIDFVGPLPLLKNTDSEFDSITVVIVMISTFSQMDLALFLECILSYHDT